MNTDFLKRLKESRGEQRSYLVRFLLNFYRAALLAHRTRLEDDLRPEAYRNYIIAMVSCLETFYRDLFIFVLERDQSLIPLVLADLREKHTLADTYRVVSDGHSFAEIASAMVRFQTSNSSMSR